MADSDEELLELAEQFARQHGIELWNELGHGIDGIVRATSRPSAVKVLRRPLAYERERNAYQRLNDRGIHQIKEFSVPELIGWDDELLIIEMKIVGKPFLLDFAAAYLDRPPDYSPEILAESHAAKAELFGSRWSTVQELLAVLRGLGIYYMDPSPGNIRFEDDLD